MVFCIFITGLVIVEAATTTAIDLGLQGGSKQGSSVIFEVHLKAHCCSPRRFVVVRSRRMSWGSDFAAGGSRTWGILARARELRRSAVRRDFGIIPTWPALPLCTSMKGLTASSRWQLGCLEGWGLLEGVFGSDI